MIALIIHGGAGKWPENKHARAKAGCEAARDAAYRLLQNGASALDAVEEALRILEDDPLFNAGTGSHPNAAGEIEMDAIIVDGSGCRFGAVAAIQKVQHPISVARRVMDATPHCLLAGCGGTQFAHEQGFPEYRTELLRTADSASPSQDTVGAVALDSQGRIAAATSTGGTANKLPGRVGDSPIFGCGAYANGLAGASATGVGEDLMRVMMARSVVDAACVDPDPSRAARHGVRLLDEIHGTGGIICLRREGAVGFACNTPAMAVAFIDGQGTRASFVKA
ncbi:MAG: isoaspartyl peptidase/L-asparaginase [Candidatus Hydrogenedentes bacterium]|nr:isoaspartyl peptidase/L-asparaginase [Candidatus Hydrogenedentota bacterium]